MSATVFTGPVFSGNVPQSDGTGNYAGIGGSNGNQNLGFVDTVQAQAITQATNGSVAGVFTTQITIPAGSLISAIDLFVTAAWTGAASTLGIGTQNSATAFTPAGAVTASALGKLSVVPGTSLTQINNWLNTGNTDVDLVITSTNTGTGTAWLVVKYAQALNVYTSGNGNIVY